MLEIRYEEYADDSIYKPYVMYRDIVKTPDNLSLQMNWHEDLEIEICHSGNGTVFLDGVDYGFNKKGIVVVNTDVLHYTATKESLTYSALIIKKDFCRKMGIDLQTLKFSSVIEDNRLYELVDNLKKGDALGDISLKDAKQTKTLLEILILLTEQYSVASDIKAKREEFRRVKEVINYIKQNYKQRIKLDDIAANLYTDKYVLSRNFKKVTGKTVVEYLNLYRCTVATKLIREGATVSQAAFNCGFNNLSFFTKTFKAHIGKLPREIK